MSVIIPFVGRAQLTAQAGQELDQLVARLKADNQPVFVEIQGHTDSTGSDTYNLDLSKRRADAVARYLISRGVSSARIQTQGMGEAYAVADNNTAEGRARNRRVEVKITPVSTDDVRSAN